ncbi:phytanoyl-CoA dioxygenase family protein [Solwaraspora sp. WMMD1047]|uniref:phytanoyl-CoA dioxygenase family protein n=1 Tax=Solwaraspora sp. WMMD1047 TaxID=3016102 RepID=UPI0024169E37|nr:phytanoyl-CoA dioxygenase family protein [Solwaraspora sp. WMMD1047]MDG4830612.1 phytanoyl-CoA dioxygenase family protein [Solwaraspora sp. WMMD1047]
MSEDVLAARAREFQESGYLWLRGVFTADEIASFRRLYDEGAADWMFVHGREDPPLIVGNLVERSPRTVLPAVTHPDLLGLAEALMGPAVQLDSTVLFSADAEEPEAEGRPVHWHRDRFGYFPNGGYVAPRLIICFAYLQEMSLEYGPLRVVPGSHREPVSIPEDRLEEPYEDELLLHTSPGDVVVIHHNLLHSGTHSVSRGRRQFLGIGYNTSAMRHDESFAGPNVQALLRTARRTGDRRTQRLFGEDEMFNVRQNAGFTVPEHAAWQEWRRTDDEQTAGTSEARAQVVQARGRVSR